MDTKKHTTVWFSVLLLQKCLYFSSFCFICFSALFGVVSFIIGEGQVIFILCAADFDLENQVEPIKTKSFMVNIQRQEQQNISPEGNLP